VSRSPDVPPGHDHARAARAPDPRRRHDIRTGQKRYVRNPAVLSARRLRSEDWLLHEIAAELGVSISTVSRWCAGLTRRDAGWPDGSGEPRPDRPATPLPLDPAASPDGTAARKARP